MLVYRVLRSRLVQARGANRRSTANLVAHKHNQMSVATLGGFPADAGGLGSSVQGRSGLGQQKPLFNQARAGTSTSGRSVLPARVQPQALTASIAEVDPRTLGPNARGYHRAVRTNIVPVRPRLTALQRLADPHLPYNSSAGTGIAPCTRSRRLMQRYIAP